MRHSPTERFRSLGIDLGVPNTAMTLLKVTVPVSTKIKVVKSSMMVSPISNLTDKPQKKFKKIKRKKTLMGVLAPFHEQLEIFSDEAYRVIADNNPDAVMAERFLGRGFTAGGALAEAISMMNMTFMMTAKRFRARHTLCTSALWKNQFRRTIEPAFTLQDMYADAKALGIVPHLIDSCLIALFGTGDPKCYEVLLNKKCYTGLLDQLATAEGF